MQKAVQDVWYVAIVIDNEEYKVARTNNEGQARIYEQTAPINNIKILAVQREISSETLAKIDMINDNGASQLDLLVAAIKSGKVSNPQKELEGLCSLN